MHARRYARIFVFCYTLALHLLIMGVLARWSHGHAQTLDVNELLQAHQVCDTDKTCWVVLSCHDLAVQHTLSCYVTTAVIDIRQQSTSVYMLSCACDVTMHTHACQSQVLCTNMLKWNGNICSQWKAKMHVCLEVARPHSRNHVDNKAVIWPYEW